MDRKPYMFHEIDTDEGFYFNKALGLPTVISKYREIETILTDLHYMACITIQIGHLSKVEYLYGSTIYTELLRFINDYLLKIRTEELRTEDIFVVDLFDVDTFIIFLSAPREHRTQLLRHLEAITERLRIHTEKKVFETFYPYLKEYARPSIGYALVINNPMVSNLRLITQLVSSAKKMGEFMTLKHDYSSRFNLQKIIIEENIHTVFQPIVSLPDLEIIGYEALSRGPEHSEFYTPQLLFVVASECGLSFELDRLCRKIALETIRHVETDRKIFVNTLTMTIHDPEFRGTYLKELLADLKIKPENVVFEVSERLAIDNYDLFRSALQDYKDIGIVQATDDIGTGYSDLERVMELNPGFMKIDISFVRGVDKSFIKQKIVASLVALARGLNSEIIAEGVETGEEYEKLVELGVPYAQGFLFGRPSPELVDKSFDFQHTAARS
ncbi:MAG: EAL domain-containing protein [Proteobacteria bacterium]|nr:EAL domain-containing protein [Pseudomonadota bacterium]MBU1737579.1 EAL domain-containing protein [Pseudomonadota bacterium]